MFRVIGFAVLLMSCLSFAGVENIHSVKDTSNILLFKADSLRYSKVFTLSEFENIRVTVEANDTAVAGIKSDSIKFYWGIQGGHYRYTTTNMRSPVWVWDAELTVDTFDVLTAANLVKQRSVLQSDGTFNYPLKWVDTTNVSGIAMQTRAFAPDWNGHYRVWVKGLIGNKIGNAIKIIVQVSRRERINVK